MNLQVWMIAIVGFIMWWQFCIRFLVPVKLENGKIVWYFLRFIPVVLVSVKKIKTAYLLPRTNLSVMFHWRTLCFINKFFSPVVIVEKNRGFFFRFAMTPRDPEEFIRRLFEEMNQEQGPELKESHG
jgi:hypothetical protein